MGLLDLLINIAGAIAPTPSLDELKESIQNDYKEDEHEKSSENQNKDNTQDD